MNKKSILGIVLGLLTGLVAVFLTQQYLQREKESINKGMEMVEVITFSDSLESGTELEKKHLQKGKMPVKYKHGNAVTLEELQMVIGRSVSHDTTVGDPLLWSDFDEDTQGIRDESFSKSINLGERALAIPVDMASGVAGVLISGDHVDVLSTVTNPISGESATITLLQNLTVLAAAGKKSENGRRTAYRNVILQVTIEEAELLVFAKDKGKLNLVLRNAADIETREDLPKVDYSNILKDDYRKKVQAKRNNIEVIKQGKSQ